MRASEVRKFLVAVLAAAGTILGEVLNASLAHGDAARWVSLGIAAIGTVTASLGVYATPNGPTVTQRVAALEQIARPVSPILPFTSSTAVSSHPVTLADGEDALAALGQLVTAPEAPVAE